MDSTCRQQNKCVKNVLGRVETLWKKEKKLNFQMSDLQHFRDNSSGFIYLFKSKLPLNLQRKCDWEAAANLLKGKLKIMPRSFFSTCKYKTYVIFAQFRRFSLKQ